jgi:hypothetical protein
VWDFTLGFGSRAEVQWRAAGSKVKLCVMTKALRRKKSITNTLLSERCTSMPICNAG